MARIGVQIFLSKQLTQLKKPCYLISKRYTFLVYHYTISSVRDVTQQKTTFVTWCRANWRPVIYNTAYGVYYHTSDRNITITCKHDQISVSFTYHDLKIGIEVDKDNIDIYHNRNYNMDYDEFPTVYLHEKLKPWLTGDLYTVAVPIVNILTSITKQQLQNLLV